MAELVTGCKAAMFQSTRPQGARRWRHCYTRLRHSFNPRARRGRDACIRVGTACGRSFNPRARRGRDMSDLNTLINAERFNPRARRGRDGAGGGKPRNLQGFNPRARRGRDVNEAFLNLEFRRFNPRARRGRDHTKPSYPRVSSGFNPRARRGRDVLSYNLIPLAVLFQSTRPQGARLKIRELTCDRVEFQSTRPQGARHQENFDTIIAYWVSIHAPAGGATTADFWDNPA